MLSPLIRFLLDFTIPPERLALKNFSLSIPKLGNVTIEIPKLGSISLIH